MSIKSQIEKSLLFWINDNANNIVFKDTEDNKQYVYLKLSENPNNILFFESSENELEICRYIIEPGYLELYEEIFGLTSKDKGIVKLIFPEFRSKRGLIK